MPPKRKGRSGSGSEGKRHREETPPERCKHLESEEDDEGQKEDREVLGALQSLAAQASTSVYGPLQNGLYLLTARLSRIRKIRSDDYLERIYKYRKKILGKGAYGTVKRVRHRDTGISYAIKEIDKLQVLEIDPGGWVKGGIFLEAACWTHILPEHPNIVKVHHIYESPQKIHIVMELLGKWTLDNFESSYNPKEICYIFRQILEAVKHLHEHGIVHYDLSVQNICMRPDKFLEPVVIDLGNARPILLPVEKQDEFEIFKLLSNKERELAESIEHDISGLGMILYLMMKMSSRMMAESDATVTLTEPLSTFKEGYSPHAADMLNLLWTPDKSPTVALLLEDPWFKTANLESDSGASSSWKQPRIDGPTGHN